MIDVGVRELRQRASAWLRRVEAGETVRVTDRGRPVALLTPLPAGSPLDRLRAEGDSDPPTLALDDFEAPLVLDGADRPSRVLAGLRRDER